MALFTELHAVDKLQFVLERQPARRPKRPESIQNLDRTRQVAIFSGLECLRDQQDLFDEGTIR